jgi:hypothetical protein
LHSGIDCMVDDVAAAMQPFKEYVVTWVEMQRHLMLWRGYDDLAERLIELRVAGRIAEAVVAIPDEYIDGLAEFRAASASGGRVAASASWRSVRPSMAPRPCTVHRADGLVEDLVEDEDR